jgi:hypothetical protein
MDDMGMDGMEEERGSPSGPGAPFLAAGGAAASLASAVAGLRFSSSRGSAGGFDEPAGMDGFNDAEEEQFAEPTQPAHALSTLSHSALSALFSPSLVMGGGQVTSADRAAHLAGAEAVAQTPGRPAALNRTIKPRMPRQAGTGGAGPLFAGLTDNSQGMDGASLEQSVGRSGGATAGQSAGTQQAASSSGSAGGDWSTAPAGPALALGTQLVGEERGGKDRSYRLVDMTGIADVKLVPVGQKGMYFESAALGQMQEAIDKLSTKMFAGQKVTLRHVARPGGKDSARARARESGDPKSQDYYLDGAANILADQPASTPAVGEAVPEADGKEEAREEGVAYYDHDGFALAPEGTPVPPPGRPQVMRRPNPGYSMQAASMTAATAAAASAASAAAGIARTTAAAASMPRARLAPGATVALPMRVASSGMPMRQRVIALEEEEEEVEESEEEASAYTEAEGARTRDWAGEVSSDASMGEAFPLTVRRGGPRGGSRSGATRGSALLGTVPRNYGLGLAAMDSSAVGGLGGDSPAPPLNTPADAAAYLEVVTERLTGALAALVQRADAARVARYAGDGSLAVPSTADVALEGKEPEARSLQDRLRAAVTALAATSSSPSSPSPAPILALRDSLFAVIASVGAAMDDVLHGSGVTVEALAKLAPARPPQSSRTLIQPVVDEMTARAQEMQQAMAAVRNESKAAAAAAGTFVAPSPAAALGGDRGAGLGPGLGSGLGLGPGLGAGRGPGLGPGPWRATAAAIGPTSPGGSEQPSGMVQPGLIRVEPNSDGRRMRAVVVTADEIMASLQSRLLTLGLFKSLGTARRQSRIATRVFFLGTAIRALAAKKAATLARKVQLLGMLAGIARERALRQRAVKLFAMGSMIASLAVRDKRRRTMKVAMLGMLAAFKRKQNSARFRTLMFALGAMACVQRTQGAPVGFQYGKNPTRKPMKAPRVRGIYWDTLVDVKGSVWERKSSSAVLRSLFPDLKGMFTEKEKVKATTEEEAAAKAKAEAAKPKEIAFLDAKESQLYSIALSGFKSLPGFKEGARFEVLKDAIMAMDQSAMGGLDGISKLEKNLPTPEMLAFAKDYQADQVKFLGFAENYVWWMSKVPLLEDRVKCMGLMGAFDENFALVNKDVTLFADACREILANPRLVDFLVDVVRPFGNELNKSSGKKDAVGIKISGLVKLAATKTADNSMTSLYYIVAVLTVNRPSLLELCTDFKCCKDATRLSLQSTETGLKALVSNEKLLTNGLAKATKAGDQKFIDMMKPFSENVTAQVELLQTRFAAVKENLLKAAEYLGEKEKSDKIDPINKPETLFVAWTEFITLLTTTLNEYRAKQAQIAKKAKEEAQKAAAQAEKDARTAKLIAAGGDPNAAPVKKERKQVKVMRDS